MSGARFLPRWPELPDYGDTPCRGMHPDFDWPDIPSYRAREVADAMHPTALLCRACPVTGLHGRCATDALRANREFSGIAGGHVFYDGRPMHLEQGVAS